MVVAGRARAIVVGVGANTAMGNIRDSILQTDDVISIKFCVFLFFLSFHLNFFWYFAFQLRKSYSTWRF